MAQKLQLLVQYLSLSASAMVLQQTVGVDTPRVMLLGFHTGPDEKDRTSQNVKIWSNSNTWQTYWEKPEPKWWRSVEYPSKAGRAWGLHSTGKLAQRQGLAWSKMWSFVGTRLQVDSIMTLSSKSPASLIITCATATASVRSRQLHGRGMQPPSLWHKVTQSAKETKLNKESLNQRPVHQLSPSSERCRGHGPDTSSSPRCSNELL